LQARSRDEEMPKGIPSSAGAGGFDALLQNLYSLRERADAAKPA